ncbi:hypothetical protein PHYC_01645 [Phycisphaerales bacterium]|nr:hypothetical protein PHYC_01645 [Phycisphaerales bacterium]
MIKGLIGAVIGGIIGAAIWAAVGYFTGYEVGWIAWGVGALAGFGMAIGVRDDGDATTGGIAAAVAIASILAGKYIVVQLLVNQVHQQISAEMSVTMEDAEIHMASQLVPEYETAGKTLVWPDGKSLDTAQAGTDFPKDLWKDTEARWKGMEPAKQEEYRAAVEAQWRAALDEESADITSGAFKESFSLWDGLWCVLAVLTAFRIGSGGGSDGDE